jgi:hypothetical protein
VTMDTGYLEHHLQVLSSSRDGRNIPAQYSMWNYGPDEWLFGYGVHQMETGEVVFLGSRKRGQSEYACIAAFSTDGGGTWHNTVDTGVFGRPTATAYLGDGVLLFANETLGRRDIEPQWTISLDHGRTWSHQAAIKPLASGARPFGEGDVFVDLHEGSPSPRLYQTVASHGPNFPYEGHVACLRCSDDMAATWEPDISPQQWVWQSTWDGEQLDRSVCEGTVTRALNGNLVAALRTDVPGQYLHHKCDTLMGLATSVSGDDGRTWSELQILYQAGRHHPNLQVLPSGDIVMTHIVRLDIRDGRLAGHHMGCEALISRDHGLSWDTAGRIILDDFAYSNADRWYASQCGHLSSTLLTDGSMLTAYGHYLSGGVAFVRWDPTQVG